MSHDDGPVFAAVFVLLNWKVKSVWVKSFLDSSSSASLCVFD